MLRVFLFADLHYTRIPDGEERLQTLCAAIRLSRPDCVISLGDLSDPTDDCLHIRAKLEACGCPVHYVMGNHEFDHNTVEEVQRFYGREDGFGAFVCKGIRFITLTACWAQRGDEVFPMRAGAVDKTDRYPLVPQDQLRKLEAELSASDEPVILLTHQSLVNPYPHRAICNSADIRALVEKHNVLLCLNGHDHSDDLQWVSGVPYLTLNAASYLWQSAQPVPRPQDMLDKYPGMPCQFLYKYPLHAMLDIDDYALRLHGMHTDYLDYDPRALGVTRWNGLSVTPTISDLRLER